jgi:endoglucanase
MPVAAASAAPPQAPAAEVRATVLRSDVSVTRAAFEVAARPRPRVAARKRGLEGAVPSPFAGRPMYVERWTFAKAQAQGWRESRPGDAALIDRIASQPVGIWLGDWNDDVGAAAAEHVEAARQTGAVPLLVAYNIPDRDCGQHSAGGAGDAAAYRAWVDDLADGIGAGPAAVVLEPDALAALDCLSERERAERAGLLAGAVVRLTRQPGVAVYLDAGNPAWVPAPEMARRLRAAGASRARGFAVNVASFHTTARSRAYGRAISRRLGNAPFVIDTSRNGAGPAPGGEWCNPPGRGLGQPPTAATGDPLVDALLWVKRPGESDGTCNGGPPAGDWWPEGALDLARR